jgi:hypothetical protein
MEFFMAKTLQSTGYKDADCYDAKWIEQKCELYAKKGLINYYKGQYYQ